MEAATKASMENQFWATKSIFTCDNDIVVSTKIIRIYNKTYISEMSILLQNKINF